jgi:pimeloyl-ACP methyl ester carboxylesterase
LRSAGFVDDCYNEMRNVPNTAVVFVHGLFLNGAEFTLLRRRLSAQQGFRTHRFSYPTVRGSMAATLAQLAQFVARIDADRIHFIGHSLGGIVLYRYFQTAPDPRAHRVVLLGSPLLGSRSAQAVARHAWLKRVIGPLVASELVDESAPRTWDCGCELGLIAGTSPMGLGRFFARFTEESDGTVAVSETRMPGHHAHLTLPVSHMGMLVSARVARHVGEFLADGRFES